MPSRKLPLEGLRVLEFSHAVMGPACGLILADMGAEVIKIEPAPHGDTTRNLKGFGTGFFTFFNRNKKSIAVNAKTEDGKKLINKLANTADILIENYGPGTMDRLGFAYEQLSATNPGLIYCSLKGFMPGPYESRVALDEIVQMMSGLAYMTGPPGQPLRAGASIIDIMGGSYGALGIMAALRERETSGEGQLVQNGLFETAAFLMGQHLAYSAISQEPLPPMPGRVSAWAIYRIFATKNDGSVFVGVTSDKHWEKFCKSFKREDLLGDKRLTTNNDRITERDWLLPDLEAMFEQMTAQEVLDLCEQAGIPFSPIAHPEDLFSDPHLKEGGSLTETELPDGRSARLPLMPLLMNGARMELKTHPPGVGEHTRELLGELGYSPEKIEGFLSAGVAAGPA